jgi:hypothetical protein
MHPHIYFLRGQWTCAAQSSGWQVWPYGKGDTPLAAYRDWLSMTRQITVTIRCSRAWWLRPCFMALKAWVLITRRMPSDALIDRVARRAVRTELVETRTD